MSYNATLDAPAGQESAIQISRRTKQPKELEAARKRQEKQKHRRLSDDRSLRGLRFGRSQAQLPAKKPETQSALVRVSHQLESDQRKLAVVFDVLELMPTSAVALLAGVGGVIALGAFDLGAWLQMEGLIGADSVLAAVMLAIGSVSSAFSKLIIERGIRVSLHQLELRSLLEAAWLGDKETTEEAETGVNDHQAIEWKKAEMAFDLLRTNKAREIAFARRRPGIWLTALAIAAAQAAVWLTRSPLGAKLAAGELALSDLEWSGVGVNAAWMVSLFVLLALGQTLHRTGLVDIFERIEHAIEEEFGPFAPQGGIVAWIRAMVNKLEEWKRAAGRR